MIAALNAWLERLFYIGVHRGVYDWGIGLPQVDWSSIIDAPTPQDLVRREMIFSIILSDFDAEAVQAYWSE